MVMLVKFSRKFTPARILLKADTERSFMNLDFTLFWKKDKKMKTIKIANFILLLAFVMFLENGITQDLPMGAIAQIKLEKGPVNAIAYSRSANRIAVAAVNNIHIYEASTYKKLMVFVGHTDAVLALAFSPNGKLLVSGSSDETVRLWNTDTGQLIRTRGGTHRSCQCYCILC